MDFLACIQMFCDFAEGPRMQRGVYLQGCVCCKDRDEGVDLCEFNWNTLGRHLGICEATSLMWGDCAKQSDPCLIAFLLVFSEKLELF